MTLEEAVQRMVEGCNTLGDLIDRVQKAGCKFEYSGNICTTCIAAQYLSKKLRRRVWVGVQHSYLYNGERDESGNEQPIRTGGVPHPPLLARLTNTNHVYVGKKAS